VLPARAAAKQVNAPSHNPARAPATAITAPTIGPPIGVEPWKATNHSDITRPRIFGSAPSWRVELPLDMNAMLAAPTRPRAISSVARLGASAATAIAAPKAPAASTRTGSPVLPRAATTRPPPTAPTPIAEVMKPYPLAPACSALEATTGSETWNS
jgi:hypothetical protein